MRNDLCAFACLVLTLGCSGGPELGADAGASASATINAQAGGTLVLGESSLVIPPNALENDTLITLRIEEGVLADTPLSGYLTVLAMEPDRLPLATPANLTLKLGDIAQGSSASAYIYGHGKWDLLSSVELSGSALQVQVTRTGRFTTGQ